MAEVSRSIEIDAPRDVVFRVVSDFRRYPEFLSETRRVDVHREDDRSAEVTFEIEVIRTIQYTLRFEKQPPERLSWSFVRGGFMKDNRGSWVLEDLGGGRTRATYSLDLRLGALVPSSIERRLAEVGLPSMLQRFKERAEGEARRTVA